MKFAIKFVSESEFENFLNRMDVKLKAKILAILENVELHGIFFSVDHFGGGINEFRVKQGTNIARIFWAYDPTARRVIIITHGFLKKSQKTPKSEIEKARRLLAGYLHRKDECEYEHH